LHKNNNSLGDLQYAYAVYLQKIHVMTDTYEIVVEPIKTSKLASTDFDNLTFGKTFTDHMLECTWKDGKWQQAVIKPYGPIMMEPSAKVFHYGQAIFEGMKAFKDATGEVFLFRPEDNCNRFNESAKRLAMPEVPKEIFIEGLKQLVNLDKDWVRYGEGLSLYLRPFMIASENGVAAAPSTEYKFMIVMSPAFAYYKGDVRVIIASDYSRAADGGVVRIGDKLLTAPSNDRILNGVTRRSVMQLAKDKGITLEERRISVQEIIEAAKSGELMEIFGSGTAAVIVPIKGFKHKDFVHELPVLENSYATQMIENLKDIQYNRVEDKHGWRVLI